MKLYIVQGASGRYDDFSTWIEAIFINKEKAEEFTKRRNSYIKKFKFLAETIQDGWNEDNGEYKTYTSKAVSWSWKYLDYSNFIIREEETRD